MQPHRNLKVTSPFPPAVYDTWLKLGTTLRLAHRMKNKQKAYTLLNPIVKSLMEYLYYASPEPVLETDALLDQLSDLTKPVHPMSFVMSAVYSFAELTSPRGYTPEEFLVTMVGFAEMGAALFAKPVDQLHRDLILTFEDFDQLLTAAYENPQYNLSTMHPPSKELH